MHTLEKKVRSKNNDHGNIIAHWIIAQVYYIGERERRGKEENEYS